MRQVFQIPQLRLQSGLLLENVPLSFTCHGKPDADKSNTVLIFTPFGSTHGDCRYLFGPGRPIDPARHFVIVFDTFGNGQSLSPSHCPAPMRGELFPSLTIRDNVVAQHWFVTEHLGIETIALAVGHSMGAMQAYHWASMFPRMVRRLAPICGAARTSEHNALFLDSIRRIITEDPEWCGGHYVAPPARALRRVARVWSAWAPSAGFYREQGYRRLGYGSLEEYMVGLWEANFLRRDANDILCQLGMWEHADISHSEPYGGRLEAALAAIEAKAIVLPGASDVYFPAEDSANEVRHMRNARLLPIPSPWGHWAGNGRRAEDLAFIDAALSALLSPHERICEP